MKKILLCGGGTAGHVSPALAIAGLIRRRWGDTEFLYIGRTGGKENDAVKKEGIPLREIPISGLTSGNPVVWFRILKKTVSAINSSAEIIRDFSPDLILGTGGYVSFPVILAGQRAGIPTVLHESNAAPGLVTRLLGGHCRALLFGLPPRPADARRLKRAVVVGTPVRESFRGVSRRSARRRLGIPEGDRMILAFGGSIGAGRLNELSLSLLRALADERHTHIFLATGRVNYDPIAGAAPEFTKNLSPHQILPYIDDMATYMTAADLVICRSGAGTLSELAYTGTPALLIPSPNVKGNHQYYNAKSVADAGAAVLLPEHEITEEGFIQTVKELLENDEKRRRMGNRMKTLYCPMGEERLLSVLAGILDNKSHGKANKP